MKAYTEHRVEQNTTANPAGSPPPQPADTAQPSAGLTITNSTGDSMESNDPQSSNNTEYLSTDHASMKDADTEQQYALLASDTIENDPAGELEAHTSRERMPENGTIDVEDKDSGGVATDNPADEDQQETDTGEVS